MPKNKGGNPGSTVTTANDPQTAAFIDDFRRRVTGGGFDPGRGGSDAIRQLGGLEEFGRNLRTSSGLDNPGFRDVLSGVRDQAGLQRLNARNDANDIAINRGAFGGSRGEIFEAEAIRDVNRNEANTLAGLTSDQFNRNQALGSNLGLNVANSLGGLDLQNRNLLASLFGLGSNVGGGTQTTEERQFNNPFLGALGGASLGAKIGGPFGTVGGGVLGGLGSLFG